jgi:SAM-dependent methyltransferase
MTHPSEASGRPPGSHADPSYALARSREEYERLSHQAAFIKGTTERLLRAADLEPGMRVLDVGSGAGDVAFLGAELVGPEGKVVGVDGAALAVARAASWSAWPGMAGAGVPGPRPLPPPLAPGTRCYLLTADRATLTGRASMSSLRKTRVSRSTR